MELEHIIKFTNFINEFRDIERAILLKDSDQLENDVKHSYQLAMLGLYMASALKLPLNIDKVIRLSLVHDLVEVYAGDTYVHDPDRRATQAQREAEALVKLEEEFTDFPEMIEAIKEYETRSSEEANFVFALDKVVPVINIYLDNGRLWHKRGVTFEQMAAVKVGKVSAHPEVQKYYDMLAEILKKDEQRLFPSET